MWEIPAREIAYRYTGIPKHQSTGTKTTGIPRTHAPVPRRFRAERAADTSKGIEKAQQQVEVWPPSKISIRIKEWTQWSE